MANTKTTAVGLSPTYHQARCQIVALCANMVRYVCHHCGRCICEAHAEIIGPFKCCPHCHKEVR